MKQVHLVQLGKIRRAARMCQNQPAGPRSSLALIAAIISAMLTYILCAMAGFSMIIWPFCVGVLCWILVYRLARKVPKSHAERLDTLLAEYQPVDQTAFQGLQENVRTIGAFNIDHVLEWADREQSAIDASSGVPQPLQSKFLNRQL